MTSSPSYRPPASPALQQPSAGLGRSVLANLVWAAANVVLIVVLTGPPPSARAAGSVVGSVLIAAVGAGVALWAVARTRRGGWAFWPLVALALPCYVVVRLLLTVAAARGGA